MFDADAVSKSLGGRAIVDGYSQRILRGDRIGLIGPNGSGKTTLLRLLVGEIRAGQRDHRARHPDADSPTSISSASSSIPTRPSPTASATATPPSSSTASRGTSSATSADFLFPRERAQSPVESLSGGERNRLMLARLFARPANVLVLDEPTNDLDIETLELLEELIADFQGTVLLVSHDRVFLDNVVTSTLVFEGTRVAEYVGGYDDYLRQTATASLPARVEPEKVESRPQGGRPREAVLQGKKGARGTAGTHRGTRNGTDVAAQRIGIAGVL